MDDARIMGWLYKHIPEDENNAGWVVDLRKVTGISYAKMYKTPDSYGNGAKGYYYGLSVAVCLVGGQILNMYFNDNAEGVDAVRHLEQFWISALQSECC